MLSELNERIILIVKNGREKYWQNEHLFGEQVYIAFPSAVFDIKEAGNCWVSGRNNAVVYHLMLAVNTVIRRRYL